MITHPEPAIITSVVLATVLRHSLWFCFFRQSGFHIQLAEIVELHCCVKHCVFFFDQGRCMAFTGMKVGVVVMVLLAMTAAMAMAAPAEYVVKWDFPTSNRYYSATQGRTYKVGDRLKFVYTQELHNVVKVGSVSDFAQCTTHTAMGPEYADGHTSVTLNKPGAHYFICSIPGHCADGMKIKVLVKA